MYLIIVPFLAHFTLSLLPTSSSINTEGQMPPVVINTWATPQFQEANKQAFSALKSGASSLDAVEIGCTACEKLQCDGTVGYGGSPDEAGETTLDAMIMDGKTMNAGAVAALRDIKNAVTVARRVLENTDHTFLVGSQATDFAVQMGLNKESLSTIASKKIWRDWKSQKCQPNFWINVTPDPKLTCGPYHLKSNFVTDVTGKNNTFYQYNYDTIGMVAIDMEKNIAVATSTNGAIHKIPGRVGDASIIGSGGYAENGVGGAAATGDGDILMRFLPSFKAVEALKRGLPPMEAANEALSNIEKYFPKYMGAVVVLSAGGEYGAACHGLDKFPFSVSKIDFPVKIVEIECKLK